MTSYAPAVNVYDIRARREKLQHKQIVSDEGGSGSRLI